MNGLRACLGLLTVVPVGGRGSDPASAGRAAAWFPWVGLILGALLVLVWWGARMVFPGALAGAVVAAAWVGLTGGLHLDGVADCCDALWGSRTREQRLQILEDPRVGTFGAAGIALLLILKALSLAALADAAFLLLAPVLGRLAILYLAARPPARDSGMAWAFHRELRPRSVVAATLVAALVSIALGLHGTLGLLLSAGLAIGLGLVAARRLGGMTGDVLGLGCELVEVVVLLVGAARLT